MSRVTGLVREIVMARLFGAGFIYDAFLLGFRIPNLTRDLFAEGALSSAFVPIFTQTLAQRGRKEAAVLSNLVATALILIVGVFCILGVIFSPALVNLLAEGFHRVPGKFDLAVKMTRIMFPFLLLVALAAQAMGVLNACNRFAVPALASTFFNLGSVAFGLILGFALAPWLGIAHITGMAIGVVLGGALQLAWQIPTLRSEGFVFHPSFDWSHPGLRKIITLMGPAILGNAAVQINVMVNTNFASQIPGNGPVSWLGYAFRFMQLPLGLFGVAIASATLPSISRSAGAGNFEEFRRTLSRSLGMVFLLTLPSSIGLIVLGRSMIARDLPRRKIPRLRHAADRAGAVVLCRRPGRIRRAQGSEPRLLRFARRAHADDHQPDLDPDQLRDGDATAAQHQLRSCGSGFVHFGGRDFWRHRTLRHPAPAHRRDPRTSARRQRREDRCSLRDHGRRGLDVQPRGPWLARPGPSGKPHRPGDFHSLWPVDFLRSLPDAARRGITACHAFAGRSHLATLQALTRNWRL